MSRTWKDRPWWVRSQDREHEVLVTDHNCGCRRLTWRSDSEWPYFECDLDSVPHDRDEARVKRCSTSPVQWVTWFEQCPSWWVRITATGPDRAKRLRKTTEAVRMARAGEDMWSFDYGVMESRVPYFW